MQQQWANQWAKVIPTKHRVAYTWGITINMTDRRLMLMSTCMFMHEDTVSIY